jgi:CubicO group peptidase (beta-lactamase class C family)
VTIVDGWTDPAFAGVRDAFASNFDAGLELGASLTVSVDGRVVADLWGGHLDAAHTRPWEPDSLVCVFSCTKGAVAIATMWAVARGLVDLDAPVASYWPEFAAEGKGTIPVRWLLTHEAALPGVSQRLPLGSLSDWDLMTSALAAEAPWWEPGTAHGYHGVTFGHLVGEVIRRATGRTLGQLLGELGDDLLMPLPAADDARTADLIVDMAPDGTFFDVWGRHSIGPAAFGNPPDCNDPAHCMTDTFRRAEIPAANMHSNARSLELLFRPLATGGGDLAPPDLVEEFGRCHVRGVDKVMELPTAFGLGFEHTIPEWRFGPGERTYGHNGSGGSLAVVDPDAGITFAYCMNRLWWGADRTDPRWGPLFDAVYGAV